MLTGTAYAASCTQGFMRPNLRRQMWRATVEQKCKRIPILTRLTRDPIRPQSRRFLARAKLNRVFFRIMPVQVQLPAPPQCGTHRSLQLMPWGG